MTPITTLETIVTPQDYALTRRNAIITGVLFVMEAAAKQFFTGPKGDAPKTDAGKIAEAQFNDMNNPVYHSPLFAETIKAVTGDAVRDFSPTGRITWKVGMVVTPVKPAHRERTDDGYKIGVNYFVTNETSGRARGEDNLEAGYLNSKHGYGVVPMSTLNDEWAPVTDRAAIEELVDLLIEKLGTKFVDDMFTNDGKSLLWVAEKLAK